MGRSKGEQNVHEFTAKFWSKYYYKMQIQKSIAQPCQTFNIYSFIWEGRWIGTASFQVEEMRAQAIKEYLFFPPFNKNLMDPKWNMSAK